MNTKQPIVRLTLLAVLVVGTFMSGSVETVGATPPIPLGCPGSTLQGPPSPANLAVCAQIPLGCPGSTQQGPVAPGFDTSTCPYGTVTPTPAPAPANTAKCYDTVRKQEGSGWSDTETVVEEFPVCTRNMEELGYVMTGLPADFPASGHCYFWSIDPAASGIEIPCDDPRITGAADYGSQVPPPPSLANITNTSTGFNGPIAASVNTLPKVEPNKTVIENAIKVVFAIAGAIAVLIIAISGFKYAMSMGEPTKTARAKDTILYAVIGLVVVVLANFLVIYIVNSLVA